MIDVGVVGFGLGGRAFHAPIIHAVPGLRLAAIVERSGSSAHEIYPDAKIVRDIEELLAIKSISLVAIATPNETHFPFAKRCLEAGRHVVADKPFTSTLAEALELVALARKHDRVLTVYQDRRFDGDFRTVQELLARGSLGKIVRFESAFDRCRPQIRTNSWKEKPAPGDDWGVEPEKDWGTMTLWGDGELAHAKVPTLRGDYRDFYAQVRDAIEG